MDDSLLNLLKNNKIFSSLDEATLKRVAPKFKKVDIDANEILFNQGGPSDCIYLLITGTLSVSSTSATGETHIVGRVEPGETVGEIGALSNEPRSLTVKTLKQCTLLKLSSKDFIELCHTNAALMYATLHPVILRSQNVIRLLSPKKVNKSIIVIPANNTINVEKFYNKLNEIADNFRGVAIISEYHPDFCETQTDLAALKEKIALIEKPKKSPHKTFYLLKSIDSALAEYCMKRADIIYIVGNSINAPHINKCLLDKIANPKLHLQDACNLILLHPEGTLKPHHTTGWLAQTSFTLHHHIRINMDNDYFRLLRFMRGKAVGLVLSGGGTRGWAHLGAIKALLEAKIPIDFIGGTSAGAMIAACYAIFESFEDAYDRFYKIVSASQHSVSWRSFTWPAISLFSAKNYTNSQIEVFNQTLIEDLWIPYFCVSCNLTKNAEEVHRSGLLWEKVRASSSIPGIIPPMVINGELHLDGGLLNNLPADVMRQLLGAKGKVIAVELNTSAPDRHKYNFPPILTFKQTILYKLGISNEPYKFPRFIDTFMRSLFVGSLTRSKQNSLTANILINLNLNKFRLLHSNVKQADRIVEIGYQDTKEQLQQID